MSDVENMKMHVSPENAKVARQLWREMEKLHLVGSDPISSRPYLGDAPHGSVLEFLAIPLNVEGKTGEAIVKRNYGGQNVSIRKIWQHPKDDLKSITVMYKREGFDPQHKNWFWVKYNPEGRVDMAGKVGFCSSCHAKARGGNYIYSYP